MRSRRRRPPLRSGPAARRETGRLREGSSSRANASATRASTPIQPRSTAMTRKKTTPTTIASPPSHARIRPPSRSSNDLSGSVGLGVRLDSRVIWSGDSRAEHGLGLGWRWRRGRNRQRPHRGHWRCRRRLSGCGTVELELRHANHERPARASRSRRAVPRVRARGPSTTMVFPLRPRSPQSAGRPLLRRTRTTIVPAILSYSVWLRLSHNGQR